MAGLGCVRYFMMDIHTWGNLSSGNVLYKEFVFSFLAKIYRDVTAGYETSEKKVSENLCKSTYFENKDIKEPFEMVVTGFISLPLASKRSAGMVGIIDYKSKFASAVAVKNEKIDNTVLLEW